MKPLPLSYYQHHDILFLSQDLLGKYLFTSLNGELTAGIIIETEAYRGPEDKASHAYNGRRTARNEVMYQRGGIAYVYRCYGIHYLFNIVTYEEDIPHACLIRAIKPMVGIDVMLKRRGLSSYKDKAFIGPGVLTQALGIDLTLNGAPLTGPKVWIEDRGVKIASEEILIGPRVGVDYAGEDAHLPWRFRAKLP